MEPLFYVVAIMGCGDGGQTCAPARVLPARYETVAQCRAALTTALAANTDVPFPTISADCQSRGAQMARVEPGAKKRG